MAVESPISRRRSCTDIPCLVVFVGFLVGWVVVAGIAMSQGSIKRFTMPSDSNDNICGVDKGVEKKPYLLFFDLTKCARTDTFIFGCPTPQLCVEKCPSTYFFGAVPALLTKAELHPQIASELKKRLLYCLPGVNRTRQTYARLVDGYHCAPWHVYSTPVAGRCLPGDIMKSVAKLRDLSREMHQGLAGTEARSLIQPGRSIRLMMEPGINISSSDFNDTGISIPSPGTDTFGVNFTWPYGTNVSWPYGSNFSWPTNVTLPGLPETSDGESITQRVLRAASEAIRQMRFVGVHLAGLTGASLLTPLLLALALLLLLRCFIWPIVVLVLASVAIGLSCAIALCALRYAELRDAAEAEQDEPGDVPLQEQPGFWLGVTIAVSCLLLLFLVLMIALRRRIVLAVVILEQCSIAIGDMLTLVLVPLVSFALQLVVCLLFVLVMVFLFGSRHEWVVSGPCDSCDRFSEGQRCFPAEFDTRCGELCPNATCSSTQSLPLYAYNAFALVWGVCFVAAVNEIAVAIAFSTWYFSTHKRLSLALPLRAYVLAITFHTGTAAFGSLLIAIVRTIRIVLNWIKSRLEKRGGGWLAGWLLKCCQCCFWCVENLIQFINRRAYIVTALESVGLCTAGRRGVAVVARNLARVAVADSVTALVLWLGRLLVVVASVLLCHALLAAAVAEPVPWLLPALFTGGIAYAVAGTTFSVFAMGVNTIFYCAMVDLDENDGSAQRPYAMSRSLAKALGVRRSPSPPPAVTAEEPPAQPPPAPRGRALSDFWAPQKRQQEAGQFALPGQVERPVTPATPPPSSPRAKR